ncbi:branched-chain amino acid aminotransferase [Litoreibacter sp.]|nr:branched-chain amino acid aminotransferase [Litoreibacter sp.]
MDWLYWNDGEWREEEQRLLSLKDNSFWMGNSVFDGARVVDDLAPDLDLHCERAIVSAERMLMKSKISAEELTQICREGAKKFPKGTPLYVRPMFYAREGFLVPDPDSTECAICIFELPMPFENGMTAAISPFKRPASDMAPTDAKASCHYPNMQRAIVWAKEQGADTALILNPDNTIGEFASANIFIVNKGRILTPEPNGSILNGLTRQRVIGLLKEDGFEVIETKLTAADVYQADEVFCTGNHVKVAPVIRIDQRTYENGEISQRARALYWDFAKTQPL